MPSFVGKAGKCSRCKKWLDPEAAVEHPLGGGLVTIQCQACGHEEVLTRTRRGDLSDLKRKRPGSLS